MGSQRAAGPPYLGGGRSNPPSIPPAQSVCLTPCPHTPHLCSAADICEEDGKGKRATVNAADVLRAVEEIELPHFAGILRTKLQGGSGRARIEGPGLGLGLGLRTWVG